LITKRISSKAQAEQEQDQDQDQEADDDGARRSGRLRVISVLEGWDKIPSQTRNRTEELVETFP
jgi:hypothetical protein